MDVSFSSIHAFLWSYFKFRGNFIFTNLCNRESAMYSFILRLGCLLLRLLVKKEFGMWRLWHAEYTTHVCALSWEKCNAAFTEQPRKVRGRAVAYLLEALCYKPEGWVPFQTRSVDSLIELILPAALWSRATQLLTEISTRCRKIMLLRSREQPVRKADNLTAICEPTV
jgi:hypothetical protein